ncbi:GNAT family N-acetyltransferase [Nostoc sp. KVJ3]|uniref:GNAT family N-acetyltransferase n=1 Tax=Nostoc sp. KVJ3 TaxID=457945 RepID=UPI002237418C|nr:GNAT family N-acetyltransferase [Nostoc sp. KVJ3]MCW5318304.1 GNAT family N-acetyltransferase [Nostoc sp. KVJ3]MCW5319079.1 GNAT family N-acetyltransferase [Nostoc sp. KVJ3]
MENVVTKSLYLVPFTQEIIKAAIIGNPELARVLAVTVLPNWRNEIFGKSLPTIADILCENPLQSEWGWGSLIIHKAEKTLIGYLMLKILPDPTGSVEIGYIIVPSYRQQGYASEATKAMMDWTLCQPGIEKVTAGCDADNIASKRVLEKIGMRLIETRGKALIWELCKTEIIE